MSFFPSSQRKTNFDTKASPSPCDYNPSLSHSKAFACAPFGSTQKLNRSINIQKAANPEISLKSNEDIFNLNDLNIKLKQSQQVSSMFKSNSNRFNNRYEQRPGPGEYQIANAPMNKARSHAAISYYHQINTKPTVPSIPIDNLGFKEDENNQMTKVIPENDSLTTFSNPQSSLNAKGVIPWKAGSMTKRQMERKPGPGDYDYKLKASKSVSSCFASASDRFGRKKVREEKAPGPGYYNSDALKKYSFNKSTQSYFNSKTTRFQRDTPTHVGPGEYFRQNNKSHSVSHIKRIVAANNEEVGNKSVHRTTIFDITNNNPGPGQYKSNYGMTYQLQKMLLRKQTTDVFPKEKRTVFENKQAVENPGPGAYQGTAEKTKKTIGKLWKKTEVVNLKQEQESSPSPVDYTNTYNTIQQKVKQLNSKLTLTDTKPFNSGSQRFKHYEQPRQAEEQHTTGADSSEIQMGRIPETKKVKRLVMTTIKVRVPFGISSSKFEEKQLTYEGPDFYNKQKEWIKPSFNIKGRLQ